KADKIAQQIGSAEITMQVDTNGTVTLKSNRKSVIAVKPVTVPKVVLVSQLNSLRGTTDIDLKWDPLECANVESCKQLFDAFGDLLKTSTPTLDPAELEK